MRIGIIGSDDRAMAIGRLLRDGGHQVTFGDPGAKDRAQRAAMTVGTRAQTPYDQAMCSDLVLFAIPREEVDRAVVALGSSADAIIVDAVAGERGNGRFSGAEMLARKLNSNSVVRALINMPQSGANVPICGDDPNAKVLVEQALRASGCLTTDRGPLANSIELESPAIAA
ncbi:MAG: NAD(P)-binding domain-containing protein [Candidatus Eremiobacteraeota bacterium]|nr:NAD(P)-binding domain-containing protein [Candidatus Eremiobacteraeota bacterium]